jgi:cadmium resistance protein CadD (predicted permease)
MSLGAAIVTAIIAFATTNLDDFAVLIVYFSKVKSSENYSSCQVVQGQFIGFSVLVIFGLFGLLFGQFLPAEYVALLGFVPILLGLKGIYGLVKDWVTRDDEDDVKGKSASIAEENNKAELVEEKKEKETQDFNEIELEDMKEQDIKIEFQLDEEKEKKENEKSLENAEKKDQDDNDDDVIELDEKTWLSERFGKICKVCMHPFVLSVSAVTIANGGDNIAVYLTLFAATNAGGVIATLVTFYIMMALWCGIAYSLISCKYVGKLLNRYGNYITPFILIGIGGYILSESVIFQ